MCIFWIKSLHGEDCDIGGDISCIFYYNETFLSFRGEDCDIENTAPCFTYFFTAKMANFEYLSTLETVTCVVDDIERIFANFSPTYCEIVIRYAAYLSLQK